MARYLREGVPARRRTARRTPCRRFVLGSRGEPPGVSGWEGENCLVELEGFHIDERVQAGTSLGGTAASRAAEYVTSHVYFKLCGLREHEDSDHLPVQS